MNIYLFASKRQENQQLYVNRFMTNQRKLRNQSLKLFYRKKIRSLFFLFVIVIKMISNV